MISKACFSKMIRALCFLMLSALPQFIYAKTWILQSWGEPSPIASVDMQSNICGKDFVLFRKISSGGGDAEIIIPGILKHGNAYKFSVIVKSLDAASINLSMRKDGAHYQTLAVVPKKISPNPELITFKGVYLGHDSGSIRIAIRDAGHSVCVGKNKFEIIPWEQVGGDSGWKKLSENFFGLHINKLGVHNSWPNYRPDLIRMWDTGTKWQELQSTPKGIDWLGIYGDRLTYYIKHVATYSPKTKIMMNIGMTPAWAATNLSNSPCKSSPFGTLSCHPPKHMQDWRAFVRELANRQELKHVKIWELWNESDVPAHWVGSPKQMVELAKIASEEIKAVHPDAILIGPNVTELGISFLNEFLLSGGGNYIDGISIHIYQGFGSEIALGKVRNYRELLRSHNLNLPIWNTESNTSCLENDPINKIGSCTKDATSTILQSVILHAAYGVHNFTHYTWEGAEQENGGLGMVEKNFNTPTKLARLYAELVLSLRGSEVRFNKDYSNLRFVDVRKNGVICTYLWAKNGEVEVDDGLLEGINFLKGLDGRHESRQLNGNFRVGQSPMQFCKK